MKINGFLLVCFVALVAKADITVPPKAASTDVTAGVDDFKYVTAKSIAGATLPVSSLPPAVVTNGSLVAIQTSLQTNYYYTPLTVTGCTLYVFLNSTNWQYDITNGCYREYPGKTNLLFNDSTGNGWCFGTNLFPNGTVNGIFEADSLNSVQWPLPTTIASWVDANTGNPDTTRVLYGGQPVLATNIVASSNMVIQTDSQPNVLQTTLNVINTPDGFPLYNLLDITTTGTRYPAQNFYGTSYGYPYTNGMEGFTAFKQNGYITGLSGDNRAVALVNFFFGNIGQYGASYEILTKTKRATVNQPGPFQRNIVNDSMGGVTMGDSPYSNHGKDIPAQGEVDIWPSTLLDRPQLVLRSGAISTNKILGAIEFDGTNFWATITNAGTALRTTILLGSQPGDGSGLTNMPISAISSGLALPVAVTVGASPFNFTNNTDSRLECYFSGGTAYSVSKNGASVYGSLVGDSYFVLQPTNSCTITYTVAPTLYTNKW